LLWAVQSQKLNFQTEGRLALTPDPTPDSTTELCVLPIETENMHTINSVNGSVIVEDNQEMYVKPGCTKTSPGQELHTKRSSLIPQLVGSLTIFTRQLLLKPRQQMGSWESTGPHAAKLDTIWLGL